MGEQIDPAADLVRTACGLAVAELRAAYERSLAFGRDALARTESLSVQGLLGLREIADRLGDHLDANTRAILDLADAQAAARTIGEWCGLHQRFLDEHLERLSGQAEEVGRLVRTHLRALQDEIARDPQT